MEAAAESSERRYNTRFRGVPRSIFTYPRSGKKANSKSNNANHVRSDIRDDFVYTKLGKKPSSQSRDLESPPKVKIKLEPPSPTSKNEKKQPKQDSSKNIIPNGTHHKETELLDENTILKIEKPDEEFSPDISPKLEKDEEIFFESTAPLEINEFQSTSNDGKSHWITSKEKLSWDASNVASYNPKTKMFRCVVCQAVGFMSRIGEHYLGTHCNAKVFHCPQCSYCSAWWRCVRNHMSKNHGVSNAPASMWKNQPLLDEIMQILQNLKYSVDCEDRVERVAENSGKRYICPKCPYATDRRDLYNRHENIHREEKPFQCYICYKLFNRADHVKKHFCRIHKDYNYDINLIRRLPSKRSRIPVSPSLNGCSSNTNQDLSTSKNAPVPKPSPISNPVTQSHLLNCLTGSPTMVKVAREIDHLPEISESKVPESESKNENTFNKSHSNLLTFLTQNAFCPKPLPKSSSTKSREPPVNDILQNALLKPSVPSTSPQNNQPKKFHCPYCPWTGPNAWAHRIHTSMHYKTFCVLCNFKSSDLKDLECHMWESHRKRLCSKCNFLADNMAVLDSHLAEVHGVKHHFSCRHCSQSFEVRSDMEAHCIFIHNQVLQECKQEGCDFCTTDPDVLETHRNEKHTVSSSKTQETSASRTLCLYCGCDFADPQSLALHEELFHENPLQKAGLRPLNPYCCSVCGYSTPKQPMMIEHMRIHTGQVLRCQAGDGCLFHTPYDTVLREHVLQTHNTDDGIVRCPHCGLRCSTRYSFVSHYQELHHPFCCQLCEEVENKYFVLPFSTSFLDSSISTLFPFAKKVKPLSSSKSQDISGLNADQDAGRRSRKQMQPRKVVQDPGAENNTTDVQNSSTRIKANPFGYTKRENKFISSYAKKIRKIAQMSLLKCRFCVKCPIYFRHRRNYLLHRQWHGLKRHQCNKCIQTFRHHYQVLLHRREHDKDITISS